MISLLYYSIYSYVYGKTFEGENFTVRIAYRKTFVVAAPFDNECLLPVNYSCKTFVVEYKS